MNVGNIPEELQNISNWMLMNTEEKDGKTIIMCHNAKGEAINSSDSALLSDFMDVYNIYRLGKHQAICFSGFGTPFVYIRLKKCFDQTDGKLHTQAESLYQKLDTYSMITQSGNDLVFFLKGRLASEPVLKEHYEIFDGNLPLRFVMTGSIYGELKPIKEYQQGIDVILKEFFADVGAEHIPAISTKSNDVANQLTTLTDSMQHESAQIHTDLPPSPESNTYAPKLVKASDVLYEPPRFLIEPYFQRGKGTMIQADNGVGKTVLLCAIAAHVSTGRPIMQIPIITPGNVLMFSVEDDLAVLRGRIEASGGDLSKCHLVDNAAGLTFNSPEVEQWIKDTNAKLVVFDPLQAFLGSSINMDKSNQTRPVFAKLFEVANRHDCAVAIIAHIGKGSAASAVVNRSLGSVDIPAAMRSILQVVQDPVNSALRDVIHIKASNSPRGQSLSYSIGDRGGIVWNGFSNMTPKDLEALDKRKYSGVPYESEPLVKAFQQLIADKPGGGFWSYEELTSAGTKLLGFPPYSSTADLKSKLDVSLAQELRTREGLLVTHGAKQGGQRGIRIERYLSPVNNNSQSPLTGEYPSQPDGSV